MRRGGCGGEEGGGSKCSTSLKGGDTGSEGGKRERGGEVEKGRVR